MGQVLGSKARISQGEGGVNLILDSDSRLLILDFGTVAI